MEPNSSSASPDAAPAAAVDAVIMAGAINRIPLFPGNRPGSKALLPINGHAMIDTVIAVLRQSAGVAGICVVGNETVLQHVEGRVDRAVGCSESLVENAWRGLAAAGTERILYCNPDQPMLRPWMVEDFLRRAHKVDADLVSSWVPLSLLGPYHEGAHKYAVFGDGQFAHGNLFLVRKQFPHAREARRRMDSLYRARKNVVRFAWAMGPRLFARFALALLTRKLPRLEETMEIVGEAFDFRIAAVLCEHPEIILDIDEPEDYAAVQRYLAAGYPEALRGGGAQGG